MASDSAVAVVNLGEQGPGSNSEVVFLPGPTTAQQCIVGDVVSSGRENGKKARKPRISESVILNDRYWFMYKHYFTGLIP